MALERVHQVMKGFTVGVIEAHQNFVRFKHLDPHHVFSLVLRRQVCEALRARYWSVDDVEDLIEAHRLQQSGDVFVGGHDRRQQAYFLARQNRQFRQQAQCGAVDTASLCQVNHDGCKVARREDPFDCRIQC